MDITIPKEEILEHERLKVLSEITLTKEKISLYERKYDTSIQEFKEKMTDKEESFQEWDDFIEWKAYSDRLGELEERLIKIKNAKHIKMI